ncbi:hypothetical protein SO802_021084 [Lithocarpus litseifolius]|uniref:coproporphyrinogen oxidase n=1 Tax=Lithocarpus litseifolius TaxID=425828 RepID=A0AAW2CED9_9ROSI
MIREAQDSVCKAIEGADGGAKFKEDVWSRPRGGGGISRVLQDGAIWEKAGVNVSVVYGVMPPEAYRATTTTTTELKPGYFLFFAAGISSVNLMVVGGCSWLASCCWVVVGGCSWLVVVVDCVIDRFVVFFW